MKHKDHYNDDYVIDLSERLHAVMPDFDSEKFCHELLGRLDEKELFARFDCIVDAMYACMNKNFDETVTAFFDLLGPELETSEGMFQHGWWLWPIGRYMERYGTMNWKLSLSFLKELTKRFTGEFAIRPLLKEYPHEVMKELINWSNDDNVHVRRLASEGVRIRLPWSQKLMTAVDEFDSFTKILTNLKDDPEKFVQKSVGNNINELFKEAPEKAQDIIAQWQKEPEPSKAQEWIIRHGMRNQKSIV